MGRTYRTLSLSLPPSAVAALAAVGATTGRTAARGAAEIVLRALAAMPEIRAPDAATRRPSWCCQSGVVMARGQLVLPEGAARERRWIPAVALLCETCGRQLHGREYEGWIEDGAAASTEVFAVTVTRR